MQTADVLLHCSHIFTEILVDAEYLARRKSVTSKSILIPTITSSTYTTKPNQTRMLHMNLYVVDNKSVSITATVVPATL